jgi:hypothetical protein
VIARLGRYGNADDPGLSLAWGAYVSAAGGKLFISDMANRRASVVRLAPTVALSAVVPAAE